MNNRLQEFIAAEGLNNRRFADKMGVQSSNVSHIINGRNKPGYDFIARMLSVFPSLNPYWLILGRGDMYVSSSQPELFTGLPGHGIGTNIPSATLDLDLEIPTMDIKQDYMPRTEPSFGQFQFPLTTAVTAANIDDTSHTASASGAISTTQCTDSKSEHVPNIKSEDDIEKVIIFYKDGRFKSYTSL